jgi:hypothetical protein
LTDVTTDLNKNPRMNRNLPTRFLSLSLVVAASLIPLGKVNGQGARADVASTQADIAQGQPTVEINGHAVPSPNDPDLGEQAILKRSEGYQPFTATASIPIYYTSNVALSRSNEQDDWIEAPVVALTYQPRLTNNLYAIATIREQLFYYDRFGSLNFGSFDAEAGFVYVVPQWHNMVLRAEFFYNRLTEKDSFESFFNNYSIFLNAEVPFRIGRAQQLTIGTDANISMDATPEPPRRNDYEVYMGYNIALTRAFTLDAVARVVARQYQLTDRVDVSEILSTSANLNISRYFTASAISTLAANQSNHAVFDYKVANVGGLLSLSVKF